MTEGDIQDAIRLALNDPELVLWRNNCGTAIMKNGARVRYGIGNPGGADLIGCYRGKFIAVEIKTERGRQSPDQKLFAELVEAKGGLYFVIRSVSAARDLLQTLRTLPASESIPARSASDGLSVGVSPRIHYHRRPRRPDHPKGRAPGE